MERSEVVILLTRVGLVDGRKPQPEQVEVWFEIVGDLSLEDALEALAHHRRTSTEWVQPAHIVGVAKVLRDRRRDRERREQDARRRRDETPPEPLSVEEKRRLNGVYRAAAIESRRERGITDPLPPHDVMWRGVGYPPDPEPASIP